MKFLAIITFNGESLHIFVRLILHNTSLLSLTHFLQILELTLNEILAIQLHSLFHFFVKFLRTQEIHQSLLSCGFFLSFQILQINSPVSIVDSVLRQVSQLLWYDFHFKFWVNSLVSSLIFWNQIFNNLTCFFTNHFVH